MLSDIVDCGDAMQRNERFVFDFVPLVRHLSPLKKHGVTYELLVDLIYIPI